MGCIDVSDTVHTVRLQFDVKMQSHSEKIAPCERTLKAHSHGAIVTAICLSQLIG